MQSRYWFDKSKWIKYWPNVNLAKQMKNTQNGRKVCKMQTKLKNVNKHAENKWKHRNDTVKMVGVLFWTLRLWEIKVAALTDGSIS